MTTAATDCRPVPPRPIAPPPALALACILVGAGLDWVLALPPLPVRWTLSLGVYVLLMTFAIFLLALREFRRFGTTIRPYGRATSLITTGPFARSRNPLYVGLCFLQLGVGLVLRNAGIVSTTPLLALLLTYGVILREEEHLQLAFGEEYKRYKDAVRRWL